MKQSPDPFFSIRSTQNCSMEVLGRSSLGKAMQPDSGFCHKKVSLCFKKKASSSSRFLAMMALFLDKMVSFCWSATVAKYSDGADELGEYCFLV